MRRIVVLLLIALVSACGDPIIMLPGGALAGNAAPPPADWSSIASVDTIQVEFRPSDPYSHNIWAVGMDANLYIATGASGTRWTPFLEQDPHVKARIGTALYSLVALPVSDQEERARVAAAYLQKYELDAADNWVEGALIYRLDRP